MIERLYFALRCRSITTERVGKTKVRLFFFFFFFLLSVRFRTCNYMRKRPVTTIRFASHGMSTLLLICSAILMD